MYNISRIIPNTINIENTCTVTNPATLKPNGKIRINPPLAIRKKPIAFANLFLSPLKVFSLKPAMSVKSRFFHIR